MAKRWAKKDYAAGKKIAKKMMSECMLDDASIQILAIAKSEGYSLQQIINEWLGNCASYILSREEFKEEEKLDGINRHNEAMKNYIEDMEKNLPFTEGETILNNGERYIFSHIGANCLYKGYPEGHGRPPSWQMHTMIPESCKKLD